MDTSSRMMRLIYVLLSPTFGMHQYTADLANRIADGRWQIADSRRQVANGRWHMTNGKWRMAKSESTISDQRPAISDSKVVLVTTTTVPRGRYSPAVEIQTPLTSHSTGFAREGLDLPTYHRVSSAISHQLSAIGREPQAIVHFTGVHAWNLPLVWALRRRKIPVIHTLHDLHPHGGVQFGGLISLWNRLLIRSGVHILVHGRRYREELIAGGTPAGRVTYAPLLHGFGGYDGEQRSGGAEEQGSGNGVEHATRNSQHAATNTPYTMVNRQSSILNPPTVLFFGRVEAYKGVDMLLDAWQRVQRDVTGARLVVAGPVGRGVTLPALPSGVELRDWLIEDSEAMELFRSASLVVLPYLDATQSALVAAAYAFGLPVIVTRTGALPEYVEEGETGWVVPSGDARALAESLCRALADPTRLQAMGQAGRAWYDEQRKLEESTLTAMYAEVLESTP